MSTSALPLVGPTRAAALKALRVKAPEKAIGRHLRHVDEVMTAASESVARRLDELRAVDLEALPEGRR
jgi:hypothetical protein